MRHFKFRSLHLFITYITCIWTQYFLIPHLGTGNSKSTHIQWRNVRILLHNLAMDLDLLQNCKTWTVEFSLESNPALTPCLGAGDSSSLSSGKSSCPVHVPYPWARVLKTPDVIFFLSNYLSFNPWLWKLSNFQIQEHICHISYITQVLHVQFD